MRPHRRHRLLAGVALDVLGCCAQGHPPRVGAWGQPSPRGTV